MFFLQAYSGEDFLGCIFIWIWFCSAYSGFVYSKTFEGVSFRTGLRGQGRGEIDFRCQSSPLPCPPRPPTPPLLTGLVWAVTNALTQVEGWEKELVQF